MKKYLNFMYGYLMAICNMALYTDFLGKEEYISRLNKPGGWIDPKISIPIYSAMLLGCLYGLFKNNVNVKTFKHERHTAYSMLGDKICFIRQFDGKVRFFSFRCPKLIRNCRFNFSVRFGKYKLFRCNIRFPFLLVEKFNGGVRIGLPNFYMTTHFYSWRKKK